MQKNLSGRFESIRIALSTRLALLFQRSRRSCIFPFCPQYFYTIFIGYLRLRIADFLSLCFFWSCCLELYLQNSLIDIYSNRYFYVTFIRQLHFWNTQLVFSIFIEVYSQVSYRIAFNPQFSINFLRRIVVVICINVFIDISSTRRVACSR